MPCETVQLGNDAGTAIICTRGTTRRRSTTTPRPNRSTNRTQPPAEAPERRSPLTSKNTSHTTTDDRTQGDRTGVPAPRAESDGPLAGFVPGARRADRVLFVASGHWSFPGKVVFEVNRSRFLLGFRASTLVVGRKHGLDDTIAHLWSRTSSIERVDDLVEALPSCDGVMGFVADLDPFVMEVYDAAVQLGLPVLLQHEGRVPWPAGSEERERVEREPVGGLRWARRGSLRG